MAEKTLAEQIAADIREVTSTGTSAAAERERGATTRADQKAAREAEDEAARRVVRIQLEEAEARDIAQTEKNLGALSDQEFEAFKWARYGI